MRLFLIAFAACLASCAPVMEATRPDPVDLSKFVPGENRIDVMAEVGSPTATVANGPQSCDIYKLYTSGPGAVGKGVIAATEAAGDVLTLGLSEVLFTPVEAATKSQKHTVLFCYGQDRKLASVRQSGSHTS